MESKKSAEIGGTCAEKGQKTCRDLHNIIKVAPQIDPKSGKNRGCVADAFLDGPWGAKRRVARDEIDPLGDHCSSKVKKCIQKGIQKSMPKKCRRYAKMDPKLEPKMLKIRSQIDFAMKL